MGLRGMSRAARESSRKQAEEGRIRQRDLCMKERDDAYATGSKDQAEYDKQLLTLSAGFLAISLAFIKDVVPISSAVFLWMLYTSFVLVGLCMIAVLFSYQFSIFGLEKVKTYWECKLAETEPGATSDTEHEFPYKHGKWIKVINWGTGALFTLGVALMIAFVIINLNHGAHMTDSGKPSSPQQVEKGANLKTPPKPAKRENSNTPKQSGSK